MRLRLNLGPAFDRAKGLGEVAPQPEGLLKGGAVPRQTHSAMGRAMRLEDPQTEQLRPGNERIPDVWVGRIRA